MKKNDNIIAELRREAGFTQKSLAEALRITDKAVSKWERGLSLPDVSLLPKLSLLLGADVSLLLGPSGNRYHEGWMGVVDCRNYDVDLRQNIYDKPMVYYILMHFLLLDIREICFLCSRENEEYLKQELFATLGFTFTFDFGDCANHNLMILNGPQFLFGSDLTHQFQGAMLAETVATVVPEYTSAPFLFCPAEYAPIYKKNPAYLYEIAVPRTLGRGVLCLEMSDVDAMMEIASFVKMYQRRSKFLIGSLEEIAYKKGLITRETLLEITKKFPYGTLLKKMVDSLEGKPTIG